MEAAVLGLIAAGGAAILTQPCDVIKTIMMTSISTQKKKDMEDREENQGMLLITKTIIDEEGWVGLFKGLTERLAHVSIGGGLYYFGADFAEKLFKTSL